MVDLRVLGPLQASRGETSLVLPGRRHRAVLARLLVARGAVVPIDRIVEDLWGGDQPAQAIAAIQTFVARLRRTLEPDRPPRSPAELLVTAAPGYALRLAPDRVDAWRFEQLVAAARDSSDEVARVQLDEALGMWRGAAFAEFADEEWARSEAQRLEDLRLYAVELRAAVSVRIGYAAEAAAMLEAHVAVNPLREHGWLGLAQALYVAGRQGDALASVRRARAVFRDELGVDPGPALAQMEADILAHAGHLTPVQPASPSVPLPARDVFAGRDDELRVLVEQANTGGVTLVSGEPGAGKSRLLAEVAARLGGHVAQGICLRADGVPPGWAWAEIVRQLAAEHPPAEATAKQLGWVLTDDAELDVDPLAGRYRTHRAVRDYLVEVGRRVPLVLLLDDVHWADEETLAILRTVLGPDGFTGAVVLAYRPTDATESAADFLASLASRLPSRIQLDGLETSAVAEILAAACETDLDPETVATIAKRTGGNPFFVHETARLLDTDGVEAAVSAVPAGVRDVLHRRIARLPAVARTVLTHAAVLGRDIELDALIELTNAAEDDVLDAVEAGLMLGLLVEECDSRIGFPHALVRDAVYTSISPLRRGRLHARAAAAIERLRPNDVGALAYHFDATNDPGFARQVAQYSRLAAQVAERRYGYREAATLWRRALEAHDTTGGSPVGRLELLLAQVRALALASATGEARALRSETLAAAVADGDPAVIARTIAAFDVPTLWSTRPYGQVDKDLVALNERARNQLPPGDSPARCRLLINLGFELEGEDDQRGRAAAEEAVAMARRLGDPHMQMMALNAAALQNYWIGWIPERDAIGEQLVGLGREHGLVAAEQLGRMALASGHAARGDFALADEHVDAVRANAREHGQDLVLAITGAYRAMRYISEGDLESALAEYVNSGRAVSRSRGWEEDADFTTGTVAVAYLSVGRGHEIAAIWEANSFDTPSYPEVYALVQALAGREVRVRPPAPIRKDYFWDVMWCIRGLLGIKIGDRARIDSAYEALLPYAHLVAGGRTCVLTLGPIATVLGDLAVARGDNAVARQHYRQAADLARRCGSVHWEHAALTAFGRVC